MQHRVIELAHENHLGIAKTIALLREKIYFVNMEAKVKAKISECMLHAAVSTSPIPQPSEPSTLPPFPVVKIVSSTSANCTILALEKIFSEHGLPQRIISDNGPSFKSCQISTYMKNS